MSVCNGQGALSPQRHSSRASFANQGRILLGAAARALWLIAFCLIGACGGGSGAPATVTVGGTISGLIGTVVLQDNGGDNLSISANGAFIFPNAIKNGATYNVTILTQPPGPSCVVSNGSGTAAADVTSVSVTCTTDPSTVFMPFRASPEQNSSGGTTGLFVISSKSLDAQPIPVVSGATTALGFSLQLGVDSSGNLTGGNPYSLTYTTVNSPGGDHVWSLNLEGTSTLVPNQVSNLTLPTHVTAQYCDSLEIRKDLNDPRSAFLILALPTDTTYWCGGGFSSFKWILIHATDSPSTNPIELPTISNPILPLYNPSGTLAGLVSVDGSHNLNFYRDETFTNPARLLTNVASFSPWQAPRVSVLSNLSTKPGYAFLVVQSLPNVTDALYRVDYTGTISADLYDFQGSYDNGILLDSNNLYFTDTAQTESVVQVAGSGGPVQVLYSESGKRILLHGVTGNNLVLLTDHGINPQTGLITTDIETLRVGLAGTPTTIASYDSPASVALFGGDLFVTVTTAPSPSGPYSYSSEIRDIAGAAQPLMPRSSFISLSAPIMQLRNITDASGVGGGSIYALDLSSPTNPTGVPLKLSTGAVFDLPAGTSAAALSGTTANVGTGAALVSNQFIGLAYDLAKGIIAPIAIPNTSVNFVSSPN